MSTDEQHLADDKMRAEISKLIAETARINSELPTILAKMNADAAHARMQTVVAPFLAAAGVIGATAAVVKLFFS